MKRVNRQATLTKHNYIITAAMIIIAAVLLSSCTFLYRGAETKEELMELYIQALKKSSEEALLQLTPEDFVAEEDVKKHIELYGGASLKINDISYEVNKMTSAMAKATLRGSRGGKPFEIKLSLQVFNSKNLITRSRWYVLIGKPDNPIPPNLPKLKLKE